MPVPNSQGNDHTTNLGDDGEEFSLEELGRDDCLGLLATQSLGRFAFGAGGDPPEVVPVNFVLDGDAVIFRTGPGSLLRATLAERVSFQADAIDPVHHTGWSVLAHGSATASDHWDALGAPLQSWAPGDKDYWVRIHIEEITGRRLRLIQLPPDLRLRHGYR